MVKYEDILYTPLDVPEMPKFDVQELVSWIDTNYPKHQKINKFANAIGASAEFQIENYPWNLTAAYLNLFGEGTGWLSHFEKKFPQLVEYVGTAFGIPIEEIGSLYFVPLRKDYSGYGFWHKDMDLSGIRIYFEFESYETDKLFFKKTKIPYTIETPHQFVSPISDHTLQTEFYEETIECKIKTRNQAFFLNNFRGIHRTYTAPENVGKVRIASFVFPKIESQIEFINKTKELVVRSAEKYKDTYARFY